MGPLRGRRGAKSATLDGGGFVAGAGARPLSDHLRTALDLRGAVIAEVDSRRLFLWIPVCNGDRHPALRHSGRDAVALARTGGRAGAARLAFALRARLAAQVLCTALGFVAVGFGCMALRTAQVAAPVLDRPVFARMTAFVETVDAGPSGGRMVLVVTNLETAFAVTKPERLRVTFKGRGPRAGDHISGQARLMPPPQPAFPGGYDFARDAWFLGLGRVGRWVGPIALSPAPRSPGYGLAWTARSTTPGPT